MKLFIVLISLCQFSYQKNVTDTLNNISLRDGRDRQSRESITISGENDIKCTWLHRTEETPWIATILYRESGRLICMGSIIDERHILTTLKCTQYAEVSNIKVLLGYYKAYWGKGSQVISIDEIFKHYVDLVILRLKKAILFSKTVQPITFYRKKSASRTRQSSDYEKYSYERVNKSARDSLEMANMFKRANIPIETEADEFPPNIEDVFMIGFPINYRDSIGNPVQKNLVYKMREDLIVPADECSELLDQPKLKEEIDPNWERRHICIKGDSKFYWSGLGGPIMDKQSMSQVGVVGAARGAGSKLDVILGLRTDIYLKWISSYSFVKKIT